MTAKNIDDTLLTSRGATVIDDELWMITVETDVLVRVDLKSNTLLAAYSIPESVHKNYQHISMSVAGAYLYIFPLYGQNIYRFDMDREIFEDVKFEFDMEGYEQKNKYRISVTYAGKVYFIGQDVSGLFEIDTLSNQMKKYDLYIDELKDMGVDLRKGFSAEEYWQENEKLYIPVYNTDIVLCFNLKEGNHITYKLNRGKDIKFRTICKTAKGFLLTCTDDRKIIWNLGNECEVKSLNLLDNKDETKCYYTVVPDEAANYYFPHFERKIIVEKGGYVDDVIELEYERDSYPEHTKSQFEARFKYKNRIYFQLRCNGCLYYFEAGKKAIHSVTINISEGSVDVMRKRMFDRQKHNIFMEGEQMDLVDFCRYL